MWNSVRMAAVAATVVMSVSYPVHPASANSLFADFTVLNGTPGSTVYGRVTLDLNSDGTVAADLLSFDGAIWGFGLDSSTNWSESNFSTPPYNLFGWGDLYGSQSTGFACIADCVTHETWTIGTPGEFNSVHQVLDGHNSQYEFFLITTPSLDELAGNSPPQSTGPLPLPTALPLFATGLGGLGLLGWRRKRKEQTAA
jgi:hypothetical protein